MDNLRPWWQEWQQSIPAVLLCIRRGFLLVLRARSAVVSPDRNIAVFYVLDYNFNAKKSNQQLWLIKLALVATLGLTLVGDLGWTNHGGYRHGLHRRSQHTVILRWAQ